MGFVDSASNDPIFPLHHSFLDRIYEKWLRRYNKDGSVLYLLYAPIGHNRHDLVVPFFPLYPHQQMVKKSFEFGYEYEYVDLYGALPRVTDKIRARRMGLAGHCVRHPELVASNLILWEPKHGTHSRGRPATTYIDTLRRDTGLSNTGEIRALMINSDLWRAAIRDSRVGVG